MNVAEMIEWLKTQDQEAIVQVVVDDRELDFDPKLAEFSAGVCLKQDFPEDTYCKI